MKKVILRAPVLSQSGYGVHSRQIARWLLGRDDVELFVEPVQWGATPWYLDSDLKDGLIGKLMKKASPAENETYDMSVQVQLPNEWNYKLARVNVGVTAAVETDVCNPAWIDSVNMMDHVIVPSSFTKDVLVKTSQSTGKEITTPIHVIPESFIDSIFDEDASIDLELDTDFNFLLVGQTTGQNADNDRKSIFHTIKLFCEEFKGNKSVGLVLKTNNGRDTKIDRQITTNLLKSVLQQVRTGEYPKVHLVHGTLNDKEIAGLYRHPKMHAFLSMTRGEGFGLPLLEAAASGLTVIATNWSGHLDFMNLGKFIKLDFELKEIHPSRVDGRIFVNGSKWAEVNQKSAKRKLRKFKEKPDVPFKWAEDLAEDIKAKFSFSAISNLYDAFFEENIQ